MKWSERIVLYVYLLFLTGWIWLEHRALSMQWDELENLWSVVHELSKAVIRTWNQS